MQRSRLAVIAAPAALLALTAAGFTVSAGARQNAAAQAYPRPATPKPASVLPGTMSVKTSSGKAATLASLFGPKATALIFVGVNCPMSNRSAPEIASVAKAIGARGAKIVLVYSNAGDSAEIKKHLKEYKLDSLDAIDDADQKLADALGAQVTPEAFVTDTSGKVLYHGRVDNADNGPAKPGGLAANRRDLLNALGAVVSGKRVPPSNRATGCMIERRETAVTGPTYAGDVASILNQNCVSCHRAGEIGPMPLDSYEAARRYASNIASVTAAKSMPPWKPVAGHGDFAGVRTLSAAQIETLATWAKADAPAGELARAPKPPVFAKGWTLGQPDLVLKMPKAWSVDAGGPDLYRCFVLPTNLTEDKQVVAVEYRAGNKAVVHHCLGYIDTKGEGRKRDAGDPGDGYTSFGGPGFNPTGEMGGWAPGNLPQFLPDGIARPLPAGSDLVLQVHYHPNGKVEQDITEVGLYFAKTPAKKKLRMYPLAAPLNIPAGNASWETTATFPVPFDAHAIFITPHMHLLGQKISVVVTLPDGTKQPMVRIDDWDFNWQDNYAYKAPFALPKGTKLTLTAVYDNSAGNIRNPNVPPKPVRWGEATTDEMCLAFVGFVADNENDPMVKLFDNLIASRGNRGGESSAGRRPIARRIRAQFASATR